MKNRLTIAAGTVLALTGCSSGAQSSKDSSAPASATASQSPSASQSPTSRPSASYSAPADNMVAPLVKATYVPDCCSLQGTSSDRLVFTSATSTDKMIAAGEGTIYMIQLADPGTTAESFVAVEADKLGLDPSDIAVTDQTTVDGETAETFKGSGTASGGIHSAAEQGVVVTHAGQTFVIMTPTLTTRASVTTDEQEFDAFLDGITRVG